MLTKESAEWCLMVNMRKGYKLKYSQYTEAGFKENISEENEQIKVFL